MKTRIDVFTENFSLPYEGITEAVIESLAAAAAGEAGLEDISMTLIITDEGYMEELNRNYRGKEGPTDVISFANRDMEFPDVESELEDLGDIFISMPVAEKQAQHYGVTLRDEIARLVVHGILHLAGYDHERSEEDAELMEQKENEILKALKDL